VLPPFNDESEAVVAIQVVELVEYAEAPGPT
jgi:hypothetical protein